MLDQVRPEGAGFWRVLTDEEKAECRQWARDHYKLESAINRQWHPVVKEECDKMNHEPVETKIRGLE